MVKVDDLVRVNDPNTHLNNLTGRVKSKPCNNTSTIYFKELDLIFTLWDKQLFNLSAWKRHV